MSTETSNVGDSADHFLDVSSCSYPQGRPERVVVREYAHSYRPVDPPVRLGRILWYVACAIAGFVIGWTTGGAQ